MHFLFLVPFLVKLVCAQELVSLAVVDAIVAVAWAEGLVYEVGNRWFLPRDLRPPKEGREILDPDHLYKFWEYTRHQLIKGEATLVDSVFNLELIPPTQIVPNKPGMEPLPFDDPRAVGFRPIASTLQYISERFEMMWMHEVERMDEHSRMLFREFHNRALRGIGDFISFTELDYVHRNRHLIDESKPAELREIEARSGAQEVKLEVWWELYGPRDLKKGYFLTVGKNAEEWFTKNGPKAGSGSEILQVLKQYPEWAFRLVEATRRAPGIGAGLIALSNSYSRMAASACQ
jgi:hypothetical protein